MARKLGRPFVYQSDEERPVTISVRLPRNLHDRLQRYAYIHRQSISELVKDGLDIRLEQSADPRDQSLETYYDNSVLQDLVRPLYQVDEHIPFDEDCTPAGVPLEAPRAELLSNSNNVIQEQLQATKPLEAAPSTFDTAKYYLGKLCRKGHDYEGSGQSLLYRRNRRCRECDKESAQARREAKAQQRRLGRRA